MGRVTVRRPVVKVSSDSGDVRQQRLPDTLAAEEPLEIRVGGRQLAVTMRTPGDDFDLVAGFLVSEGIVTEPENLVSMRYCAGTDEDGRNTYNVIDAEVAGDRDLERAARNVYTTSSCGICGKASIDAVRVDSPYDLTDGADLRISPQTVVSLPDTLRGSQQIFDRTGGLHAAGLFTADGELLSLREDVGRHNAVDKVVGAALREGQLPLSRTVLQVSGRASFELVQKAAMAGIPVLSAVSAPSSLAVDLAAELGITLLGFVRAPTFTIYAGADRVGEPAVTG